MQVTSILFTEPCLPKSTGNMHPHNYYNLKGKNIDVHFLFLSRGIILWIELPWPGNPVNTYAQHMETLDSYFDLMPHQQCILWSPPLKIETVTTDCRAKTRRLSHQSISHTSDTKLTSHGSHDFPYVMCKCLPDFLIMVIQVTMEGVVQNITNIKKIKRQWDQRN